MKNMFKVIASMACALALVACGGGSNNDTPATTIPPQPSFTKTDTVVGTGSVEAASGDLVSVHYTGYLYSDTAADKKGAKFESSHDGANTPFAFTLGRGSVIVGWDQGIPGMRVGGKRTLLIPASMAYGANERKDASGNVIIPANTALVFDVEMVAISR